VFGVLVLHPWGHRAGGALVKFRALGACSYTLYVTHVPILVLMAAAYSSQFGGLPRAGWLAAAGVMVAVAFAFAVAPVAELPFVSKRAEAEGALPARRGRWASTAAGGATGASQEVDDERLAA
jgi:peptidoglycan/LPS O-acetylase OafA/YrhL